MAISLENRNRLGIIREKLTGQHLISEDDVINYLIEIIDVLLAPEQPK